MGRLSALVLAVVLALAPLGAVAVGAAGATGAADAASVAQSGPNPCVGTVTEQPDRATVLSIQGARGGDKTDAMVVSFAPDGGVIGVHDASANGRWWAYDVDRLATGDFLLPTTQDGHTVVEEIDAETGEHVSVRHFEGLHDTHDVDLINGDELLMNDMGDEHNRVVVYNLTRGEVVWEYRFDEHNDEFPRSGGGEYGTDWTHNNDVERVEPGVFMVSVRNFDQVVAINRSTKEIEWELGADDQHGILDEQHNPDYIETEDGRATVVVADSRNDRVVEYTREGEAWNRTWVLRGGNLNEPRDADRLPNGNTLVSDRRGHRLLEVTPDGEVVWEVYGPWQPYDAERLGTIDESSGPAMADAGATGAHEMTGSASPGATDSEACYAHLGNVTSTRLVPEDDPGPVVASEQGGGETGGNDDDETPGDGGDGTDDGTGDVGTDEETDDGGVLGTTAGGSSAFGATATPVILALLAVVLGGAALASRARR